MIEKIFCIWIYVNDLTASQKFYTDVLGLKFKFRDGGWVEFDLGATTFAILERPKEKGELKAQKTHIMFEVKNIEVCKARLTAHQVEMIGAIRDEPYGKLLTFVDPNGHWLELFEPKGCGCKK
jgi:predicted enzyme related to lactoylglutathione lyase